MRAACRAAGQPLLELALSATLAFTAHEAQAASRVAWLCGATLLIGVPPSDTGAAWQHGLARLFEQVTARVVLCRDGMAAGHADLRAITRGRLSPLWVPVPAPETRVRLWRDQLGACDADCAELARSYALTGGAIRRIADEARIRAEARASTTICHDDVIAAIDAELAPQLETVGRRLVTSAAFEDLVVADETRETLMELAATICLRDQVLDTWRFRPLVRGRGVSALFYGDPGTGKT
ncbi:MAG: hypothetical protein ABIY55_20375, partial [Kofleriaceae bacterium]